jgi:hypothetical protein
MHAEHPIDSLVKFVASCSQELVSEINSQAEYSIKRTDGI